MVTAHGPVPCGPILLKIIISQAQVDSCATVSFIHISLTQLDTKMIELDSNIESFNFYVKTQIQSLLARGETTSNLLINLFKGYKAADDAEFLDFIHRKETPTKKANTNNLMADSLVTFKARKIVGKWSAPTKEQEQFLALTAKVELLKSKQSTKKAPGATPSSKPKATRKDNKWAWKDTLPKGDDPTAKTFEGKQYHVNCPHHPNQWVCHTPQECSKNPQNNGSAPPTATSTGAGSPKKLIAAKLAAAILVEGNKSDDDSQGDDY
jgi:hypothetical protein